MRLNEIKAAIYRSRLSPQEAVEVGRQNFLSFFETFEGYSSGNEPPIFRGATHDTYTTLVNPKAGGGRDSAYTSNEYTVLMSELPSWSAFPKRSHSIVCTTDAGRAEDYGSATFVVVLPDQFNLGICSRYDLWVSFPYLGMKTTIDSLHGFNNDFAALIERATKSHWFATKETSLADMKEKCRALQEWIEGTPNIAFDGITLGYFLHDLLREGKYTGPDAVFQIIASLFDPAKNKFQRYTSIPALHSLSGNKEVWTDTPCMLVPIDDYDSLREAIIKY